MPQLKEKTIKPERVVLNDGREGYFINIPMTTGAVVVVKYPPARRKRTVGKAILAKRASQSVVSKSVIRALKEVKTRKATGNYPNKDFDTLMDEL